MNTKQKISGNGSLVPVVVVIGMGIALVNWLISDDDTEKEPEITPANTETENRRKEAETTHNVTTLLKNPPDISIKSAAAPIVSARPPFSAPPSPPVLIVPKIPPPAPVPAIKSAVQVAPPPVKKKLVTREDLAAIFQCGERALTRTAAVAALKKLGFGKTAAYAALTPDGRFSAWLQFAPDGIITWAE